MVNYDKIKENPPALQSAHVGRRTNQLDANVGDDATTAEQPPAIAGDKIIGCFRGICFAIVTKRPRPDHQLPERGREDAVHIRLFQAKFRPQLRGRGPLVVDSSDDVQQHPLWNLGVAEGNMEQ